MYLASSGQSVSTSGKPISYFLSQYKKFTPFATQFITNEVDKNQIGFGKSVRLTIPRKGDLVKTIFLKMTIRPPSQARNGTQPVPGYTTTKAPGGYQVFEYIDLYIGDTRIERLTPDTMTPHTYYNLLPNQAIGVVGLVGNISNLAEITEGSPQAPLLYAPECTFMVPLPFYFFRKNAELLPLFALTKQEITLDIKFVTKDQYVIVPYSNDFNGAKPYIDYVEFLSFSMPTEYVYLSDEERSHLSKRRLDYYINQNQIQVEDFGTSLYKRFQLLFKNPVKELFFYITNNACYGCNTGAERNQQDLWKMNYWMVRLNSTVPYGQHQLSNVQITLNNEVYLPKEVADYNFLNYVQPMLHHRNAASPDLPATYIYNYSFALEPAINQPTGSLNFNAIKDVYMEVNLYDAIVDRDFVYVGTYPLSRRMVIVARSINILSIENGMAKLQLNNNLQL